MVLSHAQPRGRFFPTVGLKRGGGGGGGGGCCVCRLRRVTRMGMAAQQHFFAIVGPAGKGRVDVDQIDLLPRCQQVRAGGLAFTMNY